MNKPVSRFSIRRLLQLSRLYLSDDWRSFLLTGVVIAGLVFVSGLVMRQPAVDFLLFIMLLTGLIQVSRLFAGIHRKEKGVYLFMLPASLEEKFIIQWLASLIGYFFYAVFATLVGATLCNLFLSFRYDSFNFYYLVPSSLTAKFQVYLFFHAVFFTGALVFKRNSFLKTVLVLIALSVAMIIGGLSYAKKIVSSIGQTQFYLQFDGFYELYRYLGGPTETTVYFLNIVLTILLPLFLYGVSFYKFKNSQVKG